MVDRGDEPTEVGDHTAAEGDDRIAPGEAGLRHPPAEVPHDVERLGLLAVGHGEDHVVDPGVDRPGDPLLGDDRHPLHAGGDEVGQKLAGTVTDVNRVAAVGELHVDDDHAGTSWSRRARMASTQWPVVRSVVSRRTSATSS